MPDEMMFKPGQKAAISPDGVVDGWLAPFGGPKRGKDLQDESFSAKTDFGLDYWPSIPILYGHGQDAEVGAAKVGEISVKEIRDKGVWVQGQLDKQGDYYAALTELAEKGDLYWSSGSLSHLVVKDDRTGAIKQWPIAEATLTLTPANPWATAAMKEAEPEPVETVTAVSAPGFTVTFSYPTKEGRRHSTADHARLQQIHQLLAELGTPEPEPEPEAEAGKEAAEPPANVLTIVGNDAAKQASSELDAVKETLAEFARAEARRLIG